MASSKQNKETKTTMEPDEQDMVTLVYQDERITVQYEKISQNARTPRRATSDATGYDVYSAETGDIPPNGRRKFRSDLAQKPTLGFHLKLYNRSGLACNEGVFILGAPMIIDRDYHGNVCVTLWNTSKDKPFHLKKRDRIGQVMLERSYKIYWKHKRDLRLEQTDRDPAGFGTTGC